MGNLKDRLAQAVAAGENPDTALDVVFGKTSSLLPKSSMEVKLLPLALIDPWTDDKHSHQPFRLYTGRQKQDMMNSMAGDGLQQPIVVRPQAGRFQILSGHNRAACARDLGWSRINAIVRSDLAGDDHGAIRVMLATNFAQRPLILPSERARAYRLLLDQQNHQGKKGDAGTRTDELIGIGESVGRSTIQRYASLTQLNDDLLDILDGLRPDPKDPAKWSFSSKPPMMPLTSAEKIVKLSAADQDRLVLLFHCGTLTRLGPAQASALAELRKITPYDKDLLPEDMAFCLRLKTKKAPAAKPITLKLDATQMAQIPPHILEDPALISLIVQTIKDFALQNQNRPQVAFSASSHDGTKSSLVPP